MYMNFQTLFFYSKNDSPKYKIENGNGEYVKETTTRPEIRLPQISMLKNENFVQLIMQNLTKNSVARTFTRKPTILIQ